MRKGDSFYHKVARGEIEVDRIYESENIIAFNHPKPQYERHIVIMPKDYVKDFISLKAENELAIWDIIKVAKYVAKGLLGSKGSARFLTNMGDYQKDNYLHFHLVGGKKIED